MGGLGIRFVCLSGVSKLGKSLEADLGHAGDITVLTWERLPGRAFQGLFFLSFFFCLQGISELKSLLMLNAESRQIHEENQDQSANPLIERSSFNMTW